LQPYSCKPDPAFEQLTSCTRTQTRNRGYDYSAVGTLMHNENGAIVFLKVKVAPVKISEDEIKKETVQLSGELCATLIVATSPMGRIIHGPKIVGGGGGSAMGPSARDGLRGGPMPSRGKSPMIFR
jgi:hypothetical protein